MGSVYATGPGRPHPLGATPDAAGVNFSVVSRTSSGVELLLFERCHDREPFQVVALEPSRNKTFFFWHAYVEGLRPGAHYAYRVDGPWDPAQGHRFNRNKVLVDPYANGLTTHLWSRGA